MSLWKFLLTVTKHICRNAKYGKSQTQNVNHGIAYTDDKNANKHSINQPFGDDEVNCDLNLEQSLKFWF